MPKKLFAVTNIKTSLPGQEVSFFVAGSEVDTSKFTREQLLELHDQGAVEVRVVDDEDNKVAEAEKAEAEEAAAKAEADAKKAAAEAEVDTAKAAAETAHDAADAADAKVVDAEANVDNVVANTEFTADDASVPSGDGEPTN